MTTLTHPSQATRHRRGVSRTPARFWSRLCTLALVLLVLPAPPVLAAEVCVDTPLELQAAIANAQSNLQEDVIKLERGLYDIPNGLGYTGSGLFTGGSLRLLGGYGPDCESRQVDPANTVLHGQGSSNARVQFHNMQHALEIDGIGFYALHAMSLSSADCSQSTGTLSLRRLRIEAGNGIGLTLDSGCADYRLENLLLAGHQASGIAISIRGPADLEMVHASVVNNGGAGLAVVDASGPAMVQVDSSIFWGNAVDIDAFVTFYGNHNSFGNMTGNGSMTGSNNDNDNPLLDGSYRPSEPNSPAINSGDPSPSGGLPPTDQVGQPRAVDGYPDRGAFETGVDGNAGILLVTTNADSGPGSLRAAITTSNGAAGRQLIQFQLPGPCPQTIALQSELPALIDRVLIDGYSQPGASANSAVVGFNASLCVILQPADAPGSSLGRALSVAGSDADPVVIRGLAFSGFDAANATAIALLSGLGHVLEGNQFGGQAAGQVLLANRDNIRVDAAVRDAQIGGADAAQSNLISGALGHGILIRDGAHGVQVLGNTIGASASSLTALPNAVGVRLLNAPDNQVERNLISGNTGHGVWIAGHQADGNRIEDNRIGLKGFAFCLPPPCTPNPALANGGDGIAIENAAGDPLFSGPSGSLISANHIAYNGGDGVAVRAGQRHSISGSMHDNGGLAIDLGADGPDANDDDSAPASSLSANRGLNAPVLITAVGAAQDGIVGGNLSSTAGTYDIEIYASPNCDASGRGEARTLVDSTRRTIVGSGQITVGWGMQVLPPFSLQGQVITALARDQNGNTSELSTCLPYTLEVDTLFGDGFE